MTHFIQDFIIIWDTPCFQVRLKPVAMLGMLIPTGRILRRPLAETVDSTSMKTHPFFTNSFIHSVCFSICIPDIGTRKLGNSLIIADTLSNTDTASSPQP